MRLNTGIITDTSEETPAGNKRSSKTGFACSLKHLESLHKFVLADS